MRNIVLALTFFLALGLPIILILFAPGRARAMRIIWALIALAAPIVAFAIIQAIPILSNNSAESTQWERFFGLIFSGSGFVLPWVIFAIFLHVKPKA